MPADRVVLTVPGRTSHPGTESRTQPSAMLRSAPAVPRIVFTTALQRHVDCPEEDVAGGTVREALETYFARHAAARAYVLDDQGELRQHVVVFVDGVQVRDRASLAERAGAGTEIYVMQALSGG